jgi:o-succinylbenzoate synthase
MKLALERRELRFATPLQTSYGELRTRPLLELTLTGEDGVSGRGEAAPLEPYDGVSIERVEAALERCRPLLERAEELPRGELFDAVREAAALPQALAAIDLALWDLAGRRAGRPVCALLGEQPATAIEVNATIAATDRSGAAAAAAAAARQGYRCVKIKVGLGDDAGRVAAVRAAVGPDVVLRLDANGAWDVEQARRAIASLAPAGLELVEEPVHGLEEMRALRALTPVRVALDESAALPGALTARVADAVCLKISRCGGISALLAQAALVRSSGADVYIASTFDGPLGIAAALHAAAALAPLPPCGLATLALFEGFADPVRDGAIAVPQDPGLGSFS